MTNYLADTPSIARPWCPGCEDADPLAEVLDIRWCDDHVPDREGSADGAVDVSAYLSGTAEAGGEINRRWCEAIHGGPR